MYKAPIYWVCPRCRSSNCTDWAYMCYPSCSLCGNTYTWKDVGSRSEILRWARKYPYLAVTPDNRNTNDYLKSMGIEEVL